MEFKTTGKLGEILKSHGKEGEIILSFDGELPENFLKMESIFLEIEGGLVPFFIDHIIIRSSQTAILKLSDIDSAEEANELINTNWYLPLEEWEKLVQDAEESYFTLKGFMLVDQNDREIGIVEQVLDIPSNTLLQVRYGDNLADIPVNEETLYFIDQENKIVKNHLPDGLLEI
jgi:16S rRNA processing protein RimM